MGWLIGILIFTVSWVICFAFTYKIYCWDMKHNHKTWDEEIRKEGLIFASLHIVGVCIAIFVLCSKVPGIINDKAEKEEGFIGKFLRKLEK